MEALPPTPSSHETHHVNDPYHREDIPRRKEGRIVPEKEKNKNRKTKRQRTESQTSRGEKEETKAQQMNKKKRRYYNQGHQAKKNKSKRGLERRLVFRSCHLIDAPTTTYKQPFYLY
jgi:hypothetical protein